MIREKLLGHGALQCWNHCNVTQGRKEGVELAGKIGTNRCIIWLSLLVLKK